ncbi:hypothetical protein JZU46_07035 [bacterium]|nr:hypothetical protein [bacterium]
MTESEEYVMQFTDSMVGVPTICFLQARNYKFMVSTDSYMMKVPVKGTYKELDPDFFSEDDGDFTIYDGDDINVASLSRVLFAAKKYPNLADNQVFCPLKFALSGDEVTVYGQVVQLLPNDNSEAIAD